MIEVTDSAKEEFLQIIKENATTDSQAMRIILTEDNELDLILDEVEEEDYLEKNADGTTVLFIEPEIYEALDGFKVDCTKETGITINKES